MLNDKGFTDNKSIILNLFSGHMHDPNLSGTTVGGVQWYNVAPITFGKGKSYYLSNSIINPYADPQTSMILGNQNLITYNCSGGKTFA